MKEKTPSPSLGRESIRKWKNISMEVEYQEKDVINMAKASIPDVKVVYDSMDELLSVPDVAEKLGTSRAFVHKLIKLNLLPSIYFGRYPRVRKFTLNAFLKRFEGEDLIAVANAAERKTAYENK